MAGRPVYLSVDDEELADLAPTIGVSPEEASKSFTSAVCQELTRVDGEEGGGARCLSSVRVGSYHRLKHVWQPR